MLIVNCVKRTHVFWAEDTVGKFIDYLRQSGPFADKIYVISHNSRGYDTQFLLRKFLDLRWTPQLIMDGTKILSMIIENLHFFDSLNFLPMSLKLCPNHLIPHASRGIILTSSTRPKIWNMWVLYPEPKFYGADYMSGDDRAQFLEWYEERKTKFSAISRSSWTTT